MHPFLALPLLLTTHTPTVTIELPADTPEILIEKVVSSCNQALGGPRCRAAPTPDEPTKLYAVVSWDGVELAISLREGGADGVEVDSRHVAFSDSDPIFPQKVGRKLAERMPNALFVPIEAASHFLQEDRGEEIAAVMREWLGV